MKFLPNPRLFAKQHHSDTSEALKAFRRQGYGRHMNFMPLVDFENDVYQWIDYDSKEHDWKERSAGMPNNKY
jgi:hypothetical protein